MKKTKLSKVLPIALVSFIAIAFVGCGPDAANNNDQNSGGSVTSGTTAVTPAFDPTPYLPFIQSGASIACGAALQFAETDAAKRTALANQIYLAATAVYTLCNGTVPTPDLLKQTLLSFEVSEKDANYANFATSVTSIYSGYYAKISGNGKAAVEILEALAAGCQQAASTYSTVTSTSGTTVSGTN